MAPIDPLLSANPWDDSGSDGGSGSGVPSSVPPPPPRPLVRVMVVVSAGAAAMLLLLLLWAYRRRHRRLPSGDSGLNAELLGVASPRVDTAPAGWTLKRLALLAVAAFVASLELTGTLLIVAVGAPRAMDPRIPTPHCPGAGQSYDLLAAIIC
jgi:MYXO-CTERM domain-containing protein